MKPSYAVVLISAIFFWMPVMYMILAVFPFKGPYLFEVVPIIAGTVSMAGAVLFMLVGNLDSARRFLVIPLFLALSAIVITGIMGIMCWGITPPPLIDGIRGIGFLLLAPCSLIIFLIVHVSERIRTVSLALTLAITGVALLGIWFVAKDLPRTIMPSLGLLGYYWIIGMPIIGICFLAWAISVKDE